MCCKECQDLHTEAGKAACCKITAYVFLIICFVIAIIFAEILVEKSLTDDEDALEGSDWDLLEVDPLQIWLIIWILSVNKYF